MKILIVDDEPPIRDLCRRLLASEGFETSQSATGEEALERLSEGWDVILTDLTMPGAVDGLQLLHQAHVGGNPDVIIMTAYPQIDTVIHALREGAYDFLVKPFNRETLLRTVSRCTEKRRLSSQLDREKQLRQELEKAYHELMQTKRVNETFGHFVSPQVAQFLMSRPEEFWKRKCQRVEATMLFADVRGFTAFAGGVQPERVMEALNQIFARLIEGVNAEGGVLNKFLGDGILAIFGAPVPLKDHARAAAVAAIKARDAIEALAKERRKKGLEPLRVGFGLNTGQVLAGYMGTEERAEYSVIGAAVNAAARLEEIAKPGQILLGADTQRLLGGEFQTQMLPSVELAGLLGPVSLFELIGLAAPVPSQKK